MRLQDNVAIVTGGTKGVGKGIAIELAREGAEVFVTGRSAEPHDRAALARRSLGEGGRIVHVRCEHGQDEQVEKAFASIGVGCRTIDLLVNNVWGGYERMIDENGFTWGKPFWE